MMVIAVQCVCLFAIPWTIAHQAPLPMEFSRQEYWRGQPFPPLGHLPEPELNPGLPQCASLVAQMVKRLPTMRETWVQSLGREDPLEKEMATHSSMLAWRIPGMEEPSRLQSMGSQRVGND